MATLGEYGSLLQLGFGIGVGLSVFRAPLDLISKGLTEDLNAELGVLANVNTEKAQRTRTQLSDLKIDLAETTQRLESLHIPFLTAAVLVALVNWFLLWRASTSAGYQLSSGEEWWLFLISGPIYGLIGVLLWGWAQFLLLPLRGRLDTIRRG